MKSIVEIYGSVAVHRLAYSKILGSTAYTGKVAKKQRTVR